MPPAQLTLFGAATDGLAHPPPASPAIAGERTHAACLALAQHLREGLARGQSFTAASLLALAPSMSIQGAYEALQLAVNHLIASDPRWAPASDLNGVRGHLERFHALEQRLPVQAVRSAEQEAYQQFSTPPAYAALVAWVSGLTSASVVLEPSIGTGSLAAFACAAGAQVVGNELSPRRAALARTLRGVTRVTAENAEHLSALAGRLDLPAPTVVLMNPPFTATAGRLARRERDLALRHVAEAYALLQPGGRLVAILGGGMGTRSALHRSWWASLARQATVVADIGIAGDVYRRYGTTFATRLLVLDRPGSGASPRGIGGTLVGDAESLVEAAELLEPVRRRQTTAEPTSIPASVAQPSAAAAVPLSAPVAPAAPVAAAPASAPSEPDPEAAYVPYRPTIAVPGAQPHPADLVESAAMASVQAPAVAFEPRLEPEVVRSGALSAAQLDQVIRAGAAHERHLPDGRRQGYFIGDGTGVGKGRVIAGIIRDSWNRGRRRAIWISKNGKLLRDAIRDWVDLGGRPSDLLPLKRFRPGEAIDAPAGILFATYDTLKQGSNVVRSEEQAVATGRLRQVVDWLDEAFEGVIAFDESHLMQNAIDHEGFRGIRDASARALVGIDLQRLVPQARVLYVSATGATEVGNLGYADRLGLWGEGTAFPGLTQFVSAIQGAGIAAMEVVARDLKAMGLYHARALSFHGVAYDRLEHVLTEDQRAIYDRLADAWQLVLRNIEQALVITGAGRSGTAVAAARSQFWGYQQRFFAQVLTALPMPTVIAAIERDLAAGHAVVLQLVNTNAAAQERALLQRIAAAADADDDLDLDQLDTTPREQLLGYVERLFPVARFERYTDEDGNERSRPVLDGEGRPVLDPAALALRDALLRDLRQIRVPDGPLDQILTAFGPEAVAEVTGRSRRVVSKRQRDGSFAAVLERRTEAQVAREVDDFQADRRRILVMSDAGGTGQSFHADRRAVNQRLRRHYVLQPGWRADQAIQGLGRTHRSNQVQPPEYILVTTNLAAQKRFTSAIARRLDQLGALTKGQRQSGSTALFAASDNLEGPLARDALALLLRDVRAGRDAALLDRVDFEAQTGLTLEKTTRDGQVMAVDVPIAQFLNRLLSVKTAVQNQLFGAFARRLELVTEQARQAGTLDRGVEVLHAERVEILEERESHCDPRSGAPTRYVRLRVSRRYRSVSWRSVIGSLREEPDGRFVRHCGRVLALIPLGTTTDPKTGRIQPCFRGIGVTGTTLITGDPGGDLDQEAAKAAWAATLADLPEFHVEERHWLTGALLPVWDRLPAEIAAVYRTRTADGRHLLGREISLPDLAEVLRALGADTSSTVAMPELVQALRSGATVTLANGWRLVRRRIAHRDRVELLGRRGGDADLAPFAAELERIGVERERIDWTWRYVIADDTALVDRLTRLVEHRPVVSVGAAAAAAA